ncbi:GNAT family N-acetyltransferase [Alteribacter natronophilus]|uniref:GNAT family N-acetyltransferase n=1 Tax=Alteribacter natronophilus TaxID=2583810 RepID=UPI00110DEB1F|nr:GNAT family N-acetyltransferase [Alteribacter natronophilus]TMW72840.1 GNAT family N-acetyltransferase [Alteribacter natronophilus]
MTDRVRLVIPEESWEEEYLAFYRDWKESGEDIIPWVVEKDPSDFKAMVTFLHNNHNGIDLKEGWVRDSTYWLVNGEDRIVGAVNIRHALTPFLKTSGGHVGYGIRPGERRKGYATEILALSLNKLRKLGVEDVLVVCDEVNEASRRTIEKNGGIRADDFVEEDGNVVNRFWIRDR